MVAQVGIKATGIRAWTIQRIKVALLGIKGVGGVNQGKLTLAVVSSRLFQIDGSQSRLLKVEAI